MLGTPGHTQPEGAGTGVTASSPSGNGQRCCRPRTGSPPEGAVPEPTAGGAGAEAPAEPRAGECAHVHVDRARVRLSPRRGHEAGLAAHVGSPGPPSPSSQKWDRSSPAPVCSGPARSQPPAPQEPTLGPPPRGPQPRPRPLGRPHSHELGVQGSGARALPTAAHLNGACGCWPGPGTAARPAARLPVAIGERQLPQILVPAVRVGAGGC